MKVIYALSFVLLLSLNSFAQNIGNYTFATATNGSLATDANGNTINMNSDFIQLIHENSTAGNASAVLNMNLDMNPIDPASAPFEFWFNGTRYTQFNVNSSGLVRLDATAAPTTFTTAANVPLLAPFAQTTTSGTSRTGTVRAKLVGAAPNRTLVIEWKNVRIPNTSVTADGTYQARLYEGSGVIEFVYGMMRSSGGVTPVTYHIGIASSNSATTAGYVTTSSHTFTAAATPVANPAPVAATTIDDLNSTSDGSRRVYKWTPSNTPADPSSLNFTAVTQTSMTLNWTDNASNEVGYAVYVSIDGGTNYLLHTLTGANSTSLAISSGLLLPGTTYYWKVCAFAEGLLSNTISSSQATNAAGTKSYSGASGGIWNTAGNWTPSGVPTLSDDVTIPDGKTVNISVAAVCNNLTVGGGTSGILQFSGTTGHALTIHGDLTVAAGGQFLYGGSTATKLVYLGGSSAANGALKRGNLVVDGTLDFYITAAANSTALTFFGGQPSSISGSGTTCDFYGITVNKGPLTTYTSSKASILDVSRNYTYAGANSAGPFTTFTSGTLRITSTTLPVFTANPTIGANAGFWLNNSSYSVAGSTTGQTGMTNNGLLRVTDGTLNIGSAANQSIVLGNGSATMIEGGTVNVAGYLGATTTSWVINYKQTGGAITTVTSSNSTNSVGSFDLGLSPSSYFEMSGGSIAVRKASTATTKVDLRGCAGSTKLTNGTVSLGDASSGAIQNFAYVYGGHFPNFTVDALYAHTVSIVGGYTLNIWGDYTKTSTGTLTTSSGSMVFRGGISSAGTITATSGSLYFWGSAAQTLGGTLTTPLNIFVNNSAGVTIPPTTMPTTNATVWLLNGSLATSSGVLSLGATGAYVTKIVRDNGSFAVAPTLTNLSTTAAHTVEYLYLGNSTSAVTTGTEYILSGTNTATVLTINNYNGVTLSAASGAGALNLHCGLLNTTTTNLMSVLNSAAASVAGFSQYSYVNGPLNRAILSGTGTFNFPVGTASAYARYDLPITTATGGTLNTQVEYIEASTGGSAGTGLASLNNRYWKVEKTTGTGNLTNFLPVVYTSGLTNGIRLGYSATLAGAYTNYSTAPVSGSLTSITPVTITGTAPQAAYFVLGNAGTLSGTITSYTDLASIAHALRTMQVTGNVLFEMSGYTGEAVPNQTVTFYPFTTDGPSYTAAIRPASGQTGFVTAGDPGSALPLINFNGIDSLTIDGRPGGTGSSEWIFRNTRTTATVAPTFQFINDATYNKLDYLNIQGQNITATSGTVSFASTSGTLGNSYNTISNCHIRENTVTGTTPLNAIFSSGLSAAVSNSYNTISNNNIYNFFTVGTAGAGIWVGAYNIGWTISGNHLYQTASRTGTGAIIRYGININNANTGSTGFTISNNYIGGTAASTGSTAWTIGGTVNQSFYGIAINTLAAGNNLISNNYIRNLNLSHGTAASATLFIGIYDQNGNNEITGNSIGGLNAADEIQINSNYGAASSTYGIYCTSGTDTVTNNTIGTISLTNTTGIVSCTGIFTAASTGSLSVIIDNNTIAKISAAYPLTTAGGFVRGIYTTGTSTAGIRTITNNTIYELSTATTNTGASSAAVTAGIVQLSTTAGNTVTHNLIHSLTNSAATAVTNIVGLYYDGATTGTNLIERNNIHSLSLLTSSNTATITGIFANSGNSNYNNNMVRLGIMPDGSAITTGNIITGINEAGSGTNNFYFNSIYIGGTGVATGGGATYALNEGSTSTTARNIKNNILWNARSNSSTGGSHYSIRVNNTTNLTSDYNNILSNGANGAVTGMVNATPYTTFNDWKSGSGKDAASASGNPQFINATGNAGAVNLHINTLVGTPVESAGTSITGLTKDYDDDARFNDGGYSGTGTAVDIGADEGEFTPVDLTAPVIGNYTLLSSVCNTATTHTLSGVAIMDASAVAVATGTRPRVYYKKSTDANTYAGNTSGDNGWKWVEASNGATPFSFTLDLTLLNGGTIAPNDAIQYFVVAQDSGANVPNPPNVQIKSGNFAANPSSVALTSAEFPITGSINSFSILPCQGTVTVGTGGNYANFTPNGGLFQAINSATVTGDLTVSVVSNISTEDGVNALNQFASPYKLLIKPNAASTRYISGAAAQGLFRMNGADRVTFDGHHNGSGRYISLSNTNTSNPTVVFLNDAVTDTLKNIEVIGVSTSTSNGVIVFSTAAAGGNDNIVIDSCNLHDGTTKPANIIYASGSASPNENSGIEITNNNIYNFFVAGSAGNGILVSSNNTGWTINGNSFYQTASTAPTATVDNMAINISNSSGNGFTVNNNFIGGNTSGATGTWTTTGTAQHRFTGIYMNVGTATASNVQGNIIRNFSMTTASVFQTQNGIFTGIYASNGLVNIGTITGNTIGSITATDNIDIINNPAASLGNVYGIKTESNSNVNIQNNKIGGITLRNPSSIAYISNFYGIVGKTSSTSATVTINGNTVGSTTVANSIKNSTGNTYNSTNNIYTAGIYCDAGNTAGTTSISNNIVSGISYTAGGSATSGSVQVVGIYRQYAPSNTIQGNRVSNLASSSPYTGTGITSGVVGILFNVTTASGHTISQNVIDSLYNSAASAAVSVTGLVQNTATSGTNIVERNFIHSLSLASSSTSAAINGIYVVAGNTTFRNNMIRVGKDAAGNDITTGYAISGINEAAGTNNYFYNSVYVGTTSGVSSTLNTYSLNNSSTSTTARSIQNNIFWNARSNSSSGKNYAIAINNTTNLTIGYNDLYASGTNGVLGSIGGTDNLNLSSYGSGNVSGNPQFIDATGNAANVNLHISTSIGTPVEGAGLAIAVTKDYDDDTRSTGTAPTGPDIGADEGAFIPVDMTPPAISYTALANQCNTNPSTITLGSVTITDGSGVNVTAGTKPRIYYKRSTNANTYAGNTSSDDGWKWVEASNGSSPFSFSMDVSLLTGSGVAAGQVIQYFIVAQDEGANVPSPPNVGINSGTFAATPSSVALTAAAFPIGSTINSFAILPCSGTVTVGASGANYTAFTISGSVAAGTAGIFQAINATTLTGNLTINVTSDISIEDGTVALNQFAAPYKIKIQSSGSVRNISGTSGSNAGLFRLDGADNVRFSGGTGTDRNLKFTNTGVGGAASTFNFLNDATLDTLNNCIIEGGAVSTTNGVILIGGSTGTTGNDNIRIENCDIKEAGSNLPTMGIYSAGSSTKENNGVVVTDCNISNFFNASTTSHYAGIYLGVYNNSWTIQNNKFFQSATRTITGSVQPHSIIYIDNAGGGYTVSGNTIGATDASGTGTMTYTSTASPNMAVIYLNVAASPVSVVQNNIISKLSYTSISAAGGTQWGTFSGIYVYGGNVNIIGNTIGATTGTGTIAVTLNTNNGGYLNGIKNDGAGTVKIYNNNIGSITATATGTNVGLNLVGIHFTQGTVAVSGNNIGSSSTSNSIQTNGTVVANSNSIIGINGATTATDSILNNNIYNITNSNTGTATYTQGIAISGTGRHLFIGNTVRNLSSTATGTGTGTSSSVVGLLMNSTSNTNALAVTGNTIYALSNSGAVNSAVTGIYYAGGSNTSNAVNKNLVYNLQPGTGTSSVATGIHLAGGVAITSNNMVRLGYDASGSAITNTSIITGISKDNLSANKIYFNSVYVGGSGVGSSPANNTYAFRRVQTGVDTVRNNIFVNARANSTTGGKHYSTYINAVTTLGSNYNVFYAPNTGGVLFSVIGTDQTTLQGWNFAVTNQDKSSGIGDPNFIAPTAVTPNLHLQSPTPAEAAGIVVTGITDDVDADVRASFTPTDIGADAANLTPVDVVRPEVSVTAIPNQSACSGTLNIDVTATVTDAGTGVATGSLAPTLWWKLGAGAGVPGDWTAVLPSSSSGSNYYYVLTISGVTSGQTYQYYVAAQDQAGTPNIGYSHFNATTPVHSDVATITTTNGAAAPFTILSVTPLSGTVTVGTSGTYPTLTGAGGLFAAINSNGLNGDLIATVISSTTETGDNALNQWTEYCGTTYSLLIQPDGTTQWTLSAAFAGNLFNINGADRVTIDGSYNGAGQYLKFVNTNTSNNTFILQNGTTDFKLLNCVVEGSANTTGSTAKAIVNIGGTASNNNIRIAGNKLGSSSWSANVIYAAGAAGDPNHHITIENNEIFNFMIWSGGFTRAYGINVTSTGNGSNWKIAGNSIYNTGINGQNSQGAINFAPGSASTNDTISGNWIGGGSALCGTGGIGYWGNSWDNYSSGENQVQGIYVNCGTIALNGNNITNILVSNSDYSGFVCMYFGGSTVPTVTNNVFGTGSNGQPDNSKIIQVAGGGLSGSYYPGYIYGIWNQSTSSSTATYSGNDFYYLFQSGAYTGGQVQVITHQTAGPVTITNNRINGPQAAGIEYNSFGIRVEPTTSTSGNLIEGNIVAGPYINNGGSQAGIINYGINVKALSTRTVSGVINKNTVWDMRNANGSGYTEGIIVWTEGTGGNGNWDITNNMVTLKNNGSTANRVGLYGIDVELNSSSTTNIQYNTVLISGDNPSSEAGAYDVSSYAFFRFPNNTGTVTGDVTTLKNNVFINKRRYSNSASYGHFAIANFGTSNYATNFSVSDYNFLQSNSASKCYVGQWGTVTQTSLADWQTASGKDANSYTATYTTGASNFGTTTLNPENLFANALSDLHISQTDGQSYLFVNNRGTPISVTTDYDGQTRNSTNPDLGADEFGSYNDAGVIAVKPNCNGTSVDVTIKNYGSAVLNSVTVNWTVNGNSNTAGSWSSMNLASGATVVKTINLTNPTSFTAATAYNVIATTANPNGVTDENTANDSYTANPLYYGMGATVYVGTTGSPKFSTYNELFNTINNSVLTANLSVQVNAGTSEPSTPTFLNAVGYCGGTRTITITPASATIYTATGTTGTSAYQGMIGFNGAANVTIDGNYSGAGQYLRFRNNSGTYPTFAFRNDANVITVKNSLIEGNNNTTYVSGGITNAPGIIFIGDAAASGSGNRNISFTGNTIRDRSDATGVPANAVFSYNTTSGVYNKNISIKNNNIFNFSQTGVYLPDNAGNGTAWNISGNSFYCTSDMSSYQSAVPQHIAIYLKSSASHTDTIRKNFIGGSATGATGTWSNSNDYLDFEGIRLEIGGTGSQITLVDSNTIRNISLTGTELSMFMGVRVKTGLVDITNNTIGDLLATMNSPSILVSGSGTPNYTNDNVQVFGIWNYSTSASTISGNVVAGIRSTAPYNTESGHSYLTGIRRGAREYGTNALNVYAGKSIIRGNTIANLFSESSLSNVNMNGKYQDKVWPAALSGIALRSNYGSDNRVDSNTVYNLFANATWNRWVRINGIALNAETTSDAGIVSKNRIYDLTNYNGGVFGADVYTPSISGITIGGADLADINSYVANGSYTLINNMIHLAPEVHPTKQYNNPDIYGILDVTKSGNTTKFYYNTVYITGEGKSSLPGDCPVVPSYGYMRSAAGNGETNGGTVYFKNNIIINNRTGYVDHFTICNNTSNPATGWSGSNVNYNFLSTGNTGTVAQKIVGNFQSGPATTYNFSGWKTAFSCDANSVYGQTVTGSTPSSYTSPNDTANDVVNPGAGYLFVDPDDIVTDGAFLHLENGSDDGYLFAKENALDLSGIGITTDIDGTVRSTTVPYIGAHELDACIPPAITTHPATQTVCNGDLNVTLSVVATGQAPLSYQWRKNTSNITGATNSSYIMSPVTTGDAGSYDVVVTNSCGTTTSNTATLTVNPGTTEICNNIDDDCDGTVDDGVTQSCYSGDNGTNGVGPCHSGTQTCSAGSWGICAGEVIPTTEVCNNVDDDCDGTVDDGLTRSCYSGPGGTNGVGICHSGTQTCSAGSWGICAGEVVPATEICNNLDDNCNGTVDDVAPGLLPQVSNFSISVGTVCAGNGAVVTVTSSTLTNGDYTVTYDVTGANSISSTTASMTVVTTGAGGTFTTEVLNTSGSCTVNVTSIKFTNTLCISSVSASYNFTVNAHASVSTHPSNQSECVGEDATFSIVAGGASPFTYQWEEKQISTWNTIGGATNDSYTKTSVTSGMDGYQYRCVVTNSCGTSATSNAATLTVTAPPDITYYEAGDGNNDIIYCSGTTVLKGKVTGNSPTNTWQVSNDGGNTWTNISGGAPYTINSNVDTSMLSINLTGSYSSYWKNKYRLIGANSCGNDTSAAATLYRQTSPSITVQPVKRDTICAGSSISKTYSYDVLSVDTNYLWQYYNGSSWVGVANGTPTGFSYSGEYTDDLQINTTGSAPQGTYWFRNKLMTGCGTIYTDTAMVRVRPSDIAQVSMEITPSLIICNSTHTASFTAVPVYGGSTPGYQWQLDSGSGWSNVSGATNGTYTDNSVSNGNKYRVIMTSSLTGCVAGSPDTSSFVTVTVLTGSPGVWIGGYDTNWSDYRNWCDGVPDSTTNVVIPDVTNDSGNFPVISDSAYAHNITIQANASLTINSSPGNLSLYGNLSINTTATYTHTDGILRFTGSSAQTADAINAYDVVMDNTSGVTLNGNLTVSNTLTLMNGVIATGTKNVIVTDTTASSIIAAGANVGTNYTVSYINGNLTRYFRDSSSLTYHFPVGNATKGRLVSVKSNHLSGKTGQNPYGIRKFTAFFKNGPVKTGGFQSDQYMSAWETSIPGNPYHTAYKRMRDEGTWIIEPDSLASLGTYDISLFFNGFISPALNDNQFGILKRDTGSTTFADWKPAGGTLSSTSGPGRLKNDGYALRKGLSSFSEFGIGESDNLLPIQLTTFTAEKCNDDLDALLKWNTASEINNDHFDVELALNINGEGKLSFSKIGEVQGAGTSAVEHDYHFIDSQLNKSGNRYYRLRQVDFDGADSYSDIRVLNFNTTKLEISALYPNPTDNKLNFVITTPYDKSVTISVTNILGQEVFLGTEELKEGVTTLQFDVSTMTQGVYFLNVKDGRDVNIHRKFEKF